MCWYCAIAEILIWNTSLQHLYSIAIVFSWIRKRNIYVYTYLSLHATFNVLVHNRYWHNDFFVRKRVRLRVCMLYVYARVFFFFISEPLFKCIYFENKAVHFSIERMCPFNVEVKRFHLLCKLWLCRACFILLPQRKGI